MQPKYVSFNQLILFISEKFGLNPDTNISRDSLIEDDLGITGDDGSDLLVTLETEYEINFSDENNSIRKTFGLDEDEFLFHSEGFCIFTFFLKSKREKVKPLTLGELYDIIIKLQKQTNYNIPHSNNCSEYKP